MSTNPLHRLLRGTASAAALLALALLAQGCVADNEDDCPAPPAPENNITLQFTVVTRNIQGRSKSGSESRALIIPTDPTQLGTADENYLDLQHLTFVLLDGSGKALTSFAPEVKPENPATDYYSRYTVKASIDHPYFHNATTADINFYIMVLANYQSHNPMNIAVSPGMDFAHLFDPKTVGTFAFPLTKKTGDNEPYWWEPSIAKAQYIPMSGLQNFTVAKTDLEKSSEEDPLVLSDASGDKDINMLRAIAKIEVIDHIEFDENATPHQNPIDDRVSIEKVELLGFFNRGSILPTLANWQQDPTSTETQYVTTASVPDAASYNIPSAFNTGNQNGAAILDFYYDEIATNQREDGCRVFSVYVPEYSLAKIGTSTHAWMQVTIQNPTSTDADLASRLYELKLASYDEGQPGQEIDLLRNNIYRYQINSASATLLNTQWTVCPWDRSGEINIPDYE